MDGKTKIAIIGWAAFAVMLVVFLQRCGTPNIKGFPIYTKADTITLTKYDSVEKEIKVKVPSPSGIITVEVPACVDTALILQKYFNKYYYSQTIADTNLSATISDTLSQNKITARRFTYKWLKPTTVQTIINTTEVKEQPKRALYAGGFLGFNITGISVAIGPQLSFITKKNTKYDARYDLLHKQVELGASIKIARRAAN